MPRPRSFDQDEVLRVARDHFWSTGYAAARIDAIAAATGLGKGGLYGAFDDVGDRGVRKRAMSQVTQMFGMGEGLCTISHQPTARFELAHTTQGVGQVRAGSCGRSEGRQGAVPRGCYW